MKAISLWQPWAILWLLDDKKFETRSWSTNHLGSLLVHASKKNDGEVKKALSDPFFIERLSAYGLLVSDLSFGAILGKVDLTGCYRMSTMPAPSERERRLGIWSPERYAWDKQHARLYQKPIPYRGRQGLFDVKDLT
jgi:hypothetical protein